MFKVRSQSGKNNLSGEKIRQLRLEAKPPLTQRALAREMQIHGYDIDHYAIRRIEKGDRFITDIELKAFSEVFGVSLEELVSAADKEESEE